MKPAAISLAAILAVVAGAASAQSAPVASSRTVPAQVQNSADAVLDERLARDWGLRPEEWARYRQLMQGPLGVYSRTSIRSRPWASRRAATRNATAMRSCRCRRNQSAWARRWPTSGPTTPPGSGSIRASSAWTCRVRRRRAPATGVGRLAVFVKAECPPCEQRARQLQAAGTAFDLYMVGSRQDDTRIRQWATQAGIDPGACAHARSRSITTPGAGCRSACLAICPPWCARSTANGSGSSAPCRRCRTGLGLCACASFALAQEVPPPAYQLAAQQAGVPSPVLYAVALQESGARLRGRLIPGRGRSTSPGGPNATPRAPMPAQASAGRSPGRRPTASTPASARSTSATTRSATTTPATCSIRTATSPSPRKSCRSSTRRARIGWSPSAATTVLRVARPPPATAAASTST